MAAALADSQREVSASRVGNQGPLAESHVSLNPIKKILMSFMSAFGPPRLANVPGKTTSADAPFSGSLW